MAKTATARGSSGIALVPTHPRRPKDWDDRKLIISGRESRQGEAWPDVTEQGDVRVIFESTDRTRKENVVSFTMGGGHPEIEFAGANIAQLAACVVRAAACAVRNEVCAPLSRESAELLARLEAAVAQGDEANG